MTTEHKGVRFVTARNADGTVTASLYDGRKLGPFPNILDAKTAARRETDPEAEQVKPGRHG